MSNVNDLQRQYEQFGVISELTEALEGIASYRIRQVKDRVLISKQFFHDLWGMYQGLRVEKPATQARTKHSRDLYIVITSSAGLTGDIDAAIVQRVLADYTAETTDIITIGTRGGALLHAHGVIPIRGFKQPEITQPIDTSAIVAYVPLYRRTFVYYQEFQSLSVQGVQKMELLLEAQALNADEMTRLDENNLIIAAEYLFEPDEAAVVEYLEHVMLGVALTQMILESQLAQFAARFTSMIAANSRAVDARSDTYLHWLSARRRERDEAAHEIVYALGGMQ